MEQELDLEGVDFETRAVSPFHEMGAYETLWSERGATFKSLAERFARRPGSLPSDFVPRTEAHECAVFVKRRLLEAGVESFGVRVHGAGEYPERLRDAAHPVELLYYQGWWDLVHSRSVAVVGTRKPSREGLSRTRRLVRELVTDGFTVVSGLAAGIDRMAHETAIAEGGRTIAVIGTPLSHAYPRENKELQRHLAKHFLVVSQVPREAATSRRITAANRTFFPERNVTNVRVDRGDHHRRGGRDFGHADSGARGPSTEAQGSSYSIAASATPKLTLAGQVGRERGHSDQGL